MSTPHGSKRVAIQLDTGESIHVERLSPADVIDLADEMLRYRRAQVIEAAKAAGLTPEQVYKVANEIDVKPLTWGDMIDGIIAQARWTIRCVQIAVTRAGHDPNRVDLSHVVTAAIGLIGLEVKGGKDDRPLDATDGPTAP